MMSIISIILSLISRQNLKKKIRLVRKQLFVTALMEVITGTFFFVVVVLWVFNNINCTNKCPVQRYSIMTKYCHHYNVRVLQES